METSDKLVAGEQSQKSQAQMKGSQSSNSQCSQGIRINAPRGFTTSPGQRAISETNIPRGRGEGSPMQLGRRLVSSPIVQPHVNQFGGHILERKEGSKLSLNQTSSGLQDQPKPLALVEGALDRASKKRGLDPQASSSSLIQVQKTHQEENQMQLSTVPYRSSKEMSREMDLFRRSWAEQGIDDTSHRNETLTRD
ncbi:hypothetical protein QJS10_CPB21g01590 [Acorus calamus]|uniref:Uncharacterized protein n=1 Tax=Acorus calamus TaxID=4465 RepID=A0AAV9C5S3_ACOCL|nr:hypothetical protein QJS10_CPB21g01590 [Acorus calamus]